MSAPDEMVEAVAQAIRQAESEWRSALWPRDPGERGAPNRLGFLARAVLSVPALADALYAADEGEVYVTALEMACSDGWADGEGAMQHYIEAARTRIEAAAPCPDDPKGKQ